MFRTACAGFTDASHDGGSRIPGGCRFRNPCGAAAAEVAREHGVFRTAKVLSLEYGKLKRLTTESHPDRRRTARLSAPPAAFVELLTPGTGGGAECLIELEGPRGKMRIQWKGSTTPDLAGLSRVLWESA